MYVTSADAQRVSAEAEQVINACVALARDAADHELARLVERYWRLVGDEDLLGRTPEGLLAATASHRQLAATRLVGHAALRVDRSPENAHTIIEIVTDDMPFLVDSVTAALTAHHLDVHLLVHPLVVVRREPLGGLHRGLPPTSSRTTRSPATWSRAGCGSRSTRSATRPSGTGCAGDLQRVLTDVREAVEDWPKMRQRALALADELAAGRTPDDRPPVPDKDITDSVELLRWLADDHFTFLGYREYRLVDARRRRVSGQVLEAVLGTGLGILRAGLAPARPGRCPR